MRRPRLRAAGALLLSTLLLSFAEAAWAAMCDPAMPAMQSSSMDEDPLMAGMPDMVAAPSGHECPPGSGHVHEPTGGDTDADCPFGPAGAFGCAVSASLPAIATHVGEPAPTSVRRQGVTTVLAHDLHAHAIFHPPKV